MTNVTDNQVLDDIFSLIEWVHGTRLNTAERSDIAEEIYRGWDNSDESDRDLVLYFTELHSAIRPLTKSERAAVRDQAREKFATLIRAGESNDRGRILGCIHRILEGRSHGITGVPLAPTARPATTSAPAPVGIVTPSITPVQPTPTYPTTLPTPVVAPSPVAASPIYAGAPAPAQPPAFPPAGPGAAGTSGISLDDLMAKKRATERETLHAVMISQIEAAKHKAAMKIAENI